MSFRVSGDLNGIFGQFSRSLMHLLWTLALIGHHQSAWTFNLADKDEAATRRTNQTLSANEDIENRDLPLPAELFLIIYGHEYFSSHRTVWIRSSLIALYAVFSAVGLMMNLCVVFLLVAWHRKSLRNITNTFVLALAISDVFMSGFNMPMQAYYELNETVQFSHLTCQLVFSTFGLPMHISCLVILVIGIDRYWIIIYPLRRRMTRQTAALMLFVIVCVSIVSVIPIAIFSVSSQAAMGNLEQTQNVDNTTQYRYCVENWPSPEIRLMYTVITFSVQFFMPLLLTATLYARIYFRLHERRFRKRDLERKKRTNKILVAIVVCFFVCWTPWNLFSLTLEVHAYKTQTELLNSSMFGENDLNQNVITSLQVYKNIVRNGLKSSDDFEFGAVSGDDLLHSQLRKNVASFDVMYNLSSFAPESYLLFGRHTKLVDLLLKLLAMCSGCLNPCLYGCMTETMRIIVKRGAHQLGPMQNRRLSRIRTGIQSFFMCRPPSVKGNRRMQLFSKHRTEAFGTPVYIMQCCGYQFVIRTGFHRHREQVRNLVDNRDDTVGCEHQVSTGRRPASYRRHHFHLHHNHPEGPSIVETPSNEKGEQRLISACSSGDSKPTPHASGQSAHIHTNTHGMNKSQLQLDQASFTFLHRGSATLSLNESSTKRTSILPSSEFEKTPRNSFFVTQGAAVPDSTREIDIVVQNLDSLPTEFVNKRKEISIKTSVDAPVIVVHSMVQLNENRRAISECGSLPCSPNRIKQNEASDPSSNEDSDYHQSFQKLVNIEVHCGEGPWKNSECIRPKIFPESAKHYLPNMEYDSVLLSPDCQEIGKNSKERSNNCSFSRKLSGLKTSKNQCILTPVEEVSGCATTNEGETSKSEDEQLEIIHAERSQLEIHKQVTMEAEEKGLFKKPSSKSLLVQITNTDSNSIHQSANISPNIWQSIKKRSICDRHQTERRTHTRSMSVGSPGSSIGGVHSRTDRKEALLDKNMRLKGEVQKPNKCTDNESHTSDDFAHFHKLILEEKQIRLKSKTEQQQQQQQFRPSVSTNPSKNACRRRSLPWMSRCFLVPGDCNHRTPDSTIS